MNGMREKSLRLLRLPLIVLLVPLLAPLGLVGIVFVLVTTALRWLWEQTEWTPRPNTFMAMAAPPVPPRPGGHTGPPHQSPSTMLPNIPGRVLGRRTRSGRRPRTPDPG